MKRSSKQRVLIEAFPLLGTNPSGVGKLLYSMIDALMRDDAFTKSYELTLIIPLGKRKSLDKWQLDKYDMRIKTIPLPLRVMNLLDKFHLMIPIDLICGAGIYLFPNYRRLPLLKSRSLTYVHDAAYLLHPDTVQDLNLLFLKRVVPRSVVKSDKIITLSEQSRRELQAAFPEYKDRIVIVPAGVDIRKYAYKANNQSATDILSKIGIQPKKYILFVGNIEPRKNINYLLDIYLMINKDPAYADVSLLLIGSDGWNNEMVNERIAVLNNEGYSILRPQMRVPDSDLPILYRESLLVALMSVHEGFGMTPLEALSAGARVIVSDIPVLHEVGGEAVAYAPLGDALVAATSFKAAIESSVDKRVVQRQLLMHTWEKATDALIGLLDEVSGL
jgi:glycosyltransferase involved in cell wall biosynthesis